jgi:hypothetical protein
MLEKHLGHEIVSANPFLNADKIKTAVEESKKSISYLEDTLTERSQKLEKKAIEAN